MVYWETFCKNKQEKTNDSHQILVQTESISPSHTDTGMKALSALVHACPTIYFDFFIYSSWSAVNIYSFTADQLLEQLSSWSLLKDFTCSIPDSE